MTNKNQQFDKFSSDSSNISNVPTELQLVRSSGAIWCINCKLRNGKHNVNCNRCNFPLYGKVDSEQDDLVIDNVFSFSKSVLA